MRAMRPHGAPIHDPEVLERCAATESRARERARALELGSCERRCADLSLALEPERREPTRDGIADETLRPATAIQELGRRGVQIREQLGVPVGRAEAHPQAATLLERLLHLHGDEYVVERRPALLDVEARKPPIQLWSLLAQGGLALEHLALAPENRCLQAGIRSDPGRRGACETPETYPLDERGSGPVEARLHGAPEDGAPDISAPHTARAR